MPNTYTVCLAGNPNVGKSTLFNALTGMHQHTGNWTGKTVDPAKGSWTYEGDRYCLVDLPGVYSLSGGTPEEQVAARVLESVKPDCLVVIVDAAAPARTLPLALELRPRQEKFLCCLNLMDEAERLGRPPRAETLRRALCCPVVPTSAHSRADTEALRGAIASVCQSPPDPALQKSCREAFPKTLSADSRVRLARALASLACRQDSPAPSKDWDRLFLGRFTAYPAALMLIFLVLWLTIRGANYPSALLERGFAALRGVLSAQITAWPGWLQGLLLDGLYDTTAAVVAVMLPPMVIFFPLFTLLEELGYLPRFALLMDRPFAWAGTCGRQSITMCMGCGCNAVGVTGCRIIGSPRQRLAAILTNSLTPCNGRFPALLVLLSYLGLGRGAGASVLQAVLLTALFALSTAVTLVVTRVLRRTVLKGEEGRFVLELPPFRRPKLGRLLLRSILSRTLRILARAVTVAAPAGLLIWLLSELRVGGAPLLSVLARRLDPAASVLGFPGVLLLAFVLSFPANELLLPLAALVLSAGGVLTETADVTATLYAAGLTGSGAVCAAIFTLFHWPCSTTVLTVYRETGSFKWTAAAVLLPTAVGAMLCAGAKLLLSILF